MKQRKKMKKLTTIALASAMAIGTFGISVPAKAADNSTDYTISIPATLSVANAGWNASEGITAQVKSGDSFDTSKKLTVTVASANSWALKLGENSIGYNLATASGSYSESATPASWEFSADELNAQSGTNKAMGINVQDYTTMAIPAGNYTDTVTFTAKVETAKQLHSFTLTGPYTGDTLVVEFYDGDTWSDMIAKYSLITNPARNYVGFGSDGFINNSKDKWVTTTDTVDPNETYYID